MCDYYLNTGRRRSLICPGGVGCTEHTKLHSETAEELQRRKEMIFFLTSSQMAALKGGFDLKTAKAMYEDGRSDQEIAGRLDVPLSIVQIWRKVNGLPRNKQ